MSAKYKYNPIVEALCEFQFEPQGDWDIAIPGLIYERVKDIFPIRRQAKAVNVNITPEHRADVIEFDRIQFVRKDEAAIVQIGPNLLAVNRLKPYESWEEFFPLITKGLETFTAVAGPQIINRIALRYINHIRFPGNRVKLEDFFQFRIEQGPQLPEDFIAFTTAAIFPYDDARSLLRAQIGSLPYETSETTVISLDLEYFLAHPGSVTLESVSEWIRTAHDRIEATFEACITQRSRTIFEKGGD